MNTTSPRPGRLAGLHAIVTGGGSGFGAGICARFVAEGARVLVADRDGDAAAKVAAALDAAAGPVEGGGADGVGGAGRGAPRALPLTVDVSRAADAERMVATAVERFGRLDVLVNNAGVTHLPQPLEDVGEDDFDRIVAVNMKAIYLAMRRAVPVFKANAPGADGIRGVVLNIASTAGVSPRPRLSWYNASKGWVITATRAHAVELAPFGIRVVALSPVAGETPLLRSFMGEDTPEMRAKFLATIPLGRFSTPEDLGHAACFLCSPEASLVTGVCMEVDGGRCI